MKVFQYNIYSNFIYKTGKVNVFFKIVKKKVKKLKDYSLIKIVSNSVKSLLQNINLNYFRF